MSFFPKHSLRTLAMILAVAAFTRSATATVIFGDGVSHAVTGVTADNISVSGGTTVQFSNGSAQPPASSADLFSIEGTGGSVLTANNFSVSPNSTAGIARGYQIVDSSLNVTGGNVNSTGYVGAEGITGFGASTIRVGGATVAAHLQPDSSSTFFSGSAGYALAANDTSTLSVSSGNYSVSSSGGDFAITVAAYTASKITISGGHFSASGSDGNYVLDANQRSQIDLHGGTLTSGGGTELVAFDTSVINIYGTAFSVDGVAVPFGALSATSGLLTGKLENGDTISGDNFYRDDTATINLVAATTTVPVPEPGAMWVLSLGAGALLRRRRNVRSD